MNKNILLITVIFLCGFRQDKYINPTGTYKIGYDKPSKDGEVHGQFGSILVKALAPNVIVMVLDVSMGAPGYNMGSFADTLEYLNNRAIYTDPASDPTCRISFEFKHDGINVKQASDDLDFACGFGHAVYTDGFYKKTSSGISDMEDILNEYKARH